MKARNFNIDSNISDKSLKIVHADLSPRAKQRSLKSCSSIALHAKIKNDHIQRPKLSQLSHFLSQLILKQIDI